MTNNEKMSQLQVENTQLKKVNEALQKLSTEQLERHSTLEKEMAKFMTIAQENSARLKTLTLETQKLRKRFESVQELSSKLKA